MCDLRTFLRETNVNDRIFNQAGNNVISDGTSSSASDWLKYSSTTSLKPPDPRTLWNACAATHFSMGTDFLFVNVRGRGWGGVSDSVGGYYICDFSTYRLGHNYHYASIPEPDTTKEMSIIVIYGFSFRTDRSLKINSCTTTLNIKRQELSKNLDQVSFEFL